MKTTVLMEIKLRRGQIIDPAHEQEYLASFQALARQLESVLAEKEHMATVIKVSLK